MAFGVGHVRWKSVYSHVVVIGEKEGLAGVEGRPADLITRSNPSGSIVHDPSPFPFYFSEKEAQDCFNYFINHGRRNNHAHPSCKVVSKVCRPPYRQARKLRIAPRELIIANSVLDLAYLHRSFESILQFWSMGEAESSVVC